MLKQDAIAKIEKALKITGLAAAIADTKEVDVTIDDSLTPLTEAEIQTLKDNEYKNGKTKGVEIAVKDAREKLGLDFQGKTIDGLLDAHGKKVIADAKITPNEKVTELEGKVVTLQTTVKDYESKLAAKDTEVQGVRINGELIKHIPSGCILEPDEAISVMRTKGYDFKLEGDKVVPYKDGKQLTDKLSNTMAVKDVVTAFITEKKLVPEAGGSGGRGGSDKGGAGKFSKLSELRAQFVAEGKSDLGLEFKEAAAAAKKADPEFALDA
jgi:hypothetical protein